MGIQINGNNDIISALDGSWTAEGASINTSGILTATTFKGNIVGTACTFVDGKFTGNVTIGGTLTYEDVTNIDSVGLITARTGVKLPDSQSLTLGTDDDAELKHTGANLVIRNTTGNIRIEPKSGQLAIQSTPDERTSIYFSGSKKIETTNTGAVVTGILTATGQVNLESAGSFIKSNQLKFNPSGHAYIDHGVTSQDIIFRVSNSSALDFTAISIDSGAQQTKFGKQIVVGSQGGNDVTTIGGGSGIGAYIQLDHASSGTNSKLMGNNDSWLNANHGNLGIGTANPQSRKLHVLGTGRPVEIGSTNATNIVKLYASTTGRSTYNGLDIIVNTTNGSSLAAYGGYLEFKTSASNGSDATSRLHITSAGLIQAKTRTASERRMILAGSPSNGAFNIEAHDGATGTSSGTVQGELGLYYNDGSTLSDTATIKFERGSGAPDGAMTFFTNNAEKLRITSGGLVGINTATPTAQLSFLAKRSTQTMPPICFQSSAGAGLADAAISTTDDSGGTDIMMGSNVYMGQNGAFVRYMSGYGSAAVRCQYTGKTLFYNKSGNNAPEESMRIDGDGRLKVNHTDHPGQLDDTFLSIYDANSQSGISKNYAMIALHNYGTGSPGDVSGIGFGAGASFAYTKASIGFERTTSYGRGDLVFCTNNDGDTSLVNDTDERLRIKSTGELVQYGFTGSSDGSADDLVLGNTTDGVNRGMTIWSHTSQNGSIVFADNDSNFRGAVQYIHNGDHLRFLASGEERLRITGNELRFIGGDQNSNEGSKTTKIVYRSLTATVWNTVEIGNISGSNGACSFRMTINCPNSGWSITKIYDIASAYNFTTNNWRIVKPITSTYQYDGDDFEVNIKISTSTTYLRLRKNRSTSSRSGTLQVIMEIYGKGETFNGTSATGTDSGSLSQYEGTPIGAYSDTSSNVGGQMDYNGGQRVKTSNYGALISDDNGSVIPSEFPANNRQLMVYTSTNGQPISNGNCARILIATDAKQTGAQGYHGSIDFGSSDCSASGGSSEFNWRTAAIMCRGDGDTSPAVADGDLQFFTKSASGVLAHRFDIAPNGDLTATDTTIGSLSDQRLKTNIQDYSYDLDKFKQLKTRTFDWINPEFHQEGNIRGFIAQEIETVDSYWNYQFEVSKETAKKDYDLLSDGDENYTIRDHRPGKASKLGGKDTMYVSVIQQLMAKIETLEAKVAALES